MINHARTLLLNRDGNSGVGYNAPGEEFVDPKFVAKQVPPFLSTALARMFGAAPDRLYLNYRLWQLMSLLHTSELEEFVLALDPRVTYWPPVDNDFFDKVFVATVEQFAGPGTKLFITGEHLADEGAGIVTQQWQLTVLAGNQLEIKRLTPPPTTTIVDYTVESELGSLIGLPGTGLEIRFPTAPVGTAWLVTSRARPQRDPAALLHEVGSVLGEGNTNRVFNLGATIDRTDEPYVTFRRLYSSNDLFPYKYGALLLGIVHYLDTLPQAQS